MMNRYEQAVRANMASAERGMKKPEDRRGFVIGAVLGFWDTYNREHKITEAQFDTLIGVLAGFCDGEYKDFIDKLVADYKGGNPPTIIGY